MKKVIVDTNIIFSCLLNSQGTIGDLIFNSGNVLDFYKTSHSAYEKIKGVQHHIQKKIGATE